MRPFVAFPPQINGRNASKHKALINRYGRLIYGGGNDWNGLYTAGTRPYRAKNKAVIAALREYNQVTKGFPLLKVYFIPVGQGSAKGIVPFKSGVKMKTEWGWQTIIPINSKVLKKAALERSDAKARRSVAKEINRVMDEMGPQDFWSLENGQGNEIGARLSPRPLADQRMDVDGFQSYKRSTAFDKIIELWHTYKSVKHHEFHRWGAAIIGRTVKDTKKPQDMLNWLGTVSNKKQGNKRFLRNLRARFKRKYGE